MKTYNNYRNCETDPRLMLDIEVSNFNAHMNGNFNEVIYKYIVITIHHQGRRRKSQGMQKNEFKKRKRM